ncbi:MAG: glycosyltransferase family 9 protein [Kiritimatiellae bacterium]|nr:glycosyltransferase family 9 protein [Kiritimatiellia bacterium]
MQHKILIVKLGYSETLVPEVGHTCSLGDVLRTSVILHLYKGAHVTWLTDEAAVPLLEDNPYINRILRFDVISVLQLLSERFDVVVNLEKVPGVCAMVSKINAWRHFGFRFDQETGTAQAYEGAHEALKIATEEDAKRRAARVWEDVLFSMLGGDWQGEGYILGYQPKTRPSYDIGFNIHVGPKYPLKAWPLDHWRRLEELLNGKYSVTHQQHLHNLKGYIDWVNTCRLLVTNDSLGLHLGLALKKKVIALIGPTASEKDLPPHGHLRILKPRVDRDCMPCYRQECVWADSCMRHITPEMVRDAIEAWSTA